MITAQDLHRPDTPIMFDGGMGSELLQRGIVSGESPETCNLEYPGHVLDVHSAFVEAGAQVLQTNTFGANRYRLTEHAPEATVKEVISAAVGLAKEAAQSRALVVGSVGPLGNDTASIPIDDVRDAFAEVMEQFLLADVASVVIETMTSVDEASIAVRQALIAGISTVAVTLSFSDSPDGPRTSCATAPAEAVARLQDAGAHIIGANCGSGLASMKQIASDMLRVSGVPVLIQSSAGLPETSDGEAHYPETPSSFAAFVRALNDSGVRLVGGCCGITPEHIRQAAKGLR